MRIEQIDHDAKDVSVGLNELELRIINNVLNAACSGVELHDWDFSTHIGATKTEALELLRTVNNIYRNLTHEDRSRDRSPPPHTR